MEVKGIFFNRVLTVQEILKKWGITERRLFQIADRNDFPFFIFIKKHHKPSTKEDLLLCEGPFYTYFRNGMYHIIHSKIENIVFDPQDIELFEHEHPEILRKADEMQKNLESENDHLKSRITELETELAACREQLKEARREIPDKGEHETVHGEDFPAEYDGHGLCSLVIRMRKEGKTEKEIAEFLNGDKEKWCSASQIGALLHRGGNVSADAMLKHAQRLLGKA